MSINFKGFVAVPKGVRYLCGPGAAAGVYELDRHTHSLKDAIVQEGFGSFQRNEKHATAAALQNHADVRQSFSSLGEVDGAMNQHFGTVYVVGVFA